MKEEVEESVRPEQSQPRPGSSTTWQVPEQKWREIFEEEEDDFVVNSILEEMISTAMEAIYESYLKRTVYSFIIYASHQAWLRAFDCAYLRYDPGESTLAIKREWTGDEERQCSPIDAWCCGNVPLLPRSCSCE